MTTEKNIKDLFNATAYDRNGDKLGAVKEVFVDDHTGQPTFVEVGHGLFGMSSSLVPMRGHRLSGDELQLAFDKDRIKDAPNLDADNHLTPEDQRNIYGHYQLTDARDEERYLGDERRDRGRDHRDTARPGHVHDRPDHVDPDLSPEELERRAAQGDDVDGRYAERNEALDGQAPTDADDHGTGEVRLRRHVVTDYETIEVPVTREEIRVERDDRDLR